MKLRKPLAFALAALLTFGLFTLPTTAADADTPEEYAAQVLYELGLFQGVGNKEDGSPDFDLGSTPTREQAVTMLVRLLGKDGDANTMLYRSPFTDVADWAAPYVAYAYEKGLTTGTSDTTFSGKSPVTATQYLTFVLRALGYSSGTDFQWDRAYELSHELMITEPGQYEDASAPFTRGDVAKISASALGAGMKNSEDTLLVFLNESGVFKSSTAVVLEMELLSAKKDSLSFTFFPNIGSPNVYESFKLDKVTVNGLPCTIKQYDTKRTAIAAHPPLEALYPDAFNYSIISFDEEAAQKAATESHSPGDGTSYPILVFTFEGTGTLKGGQTMKERFSESVYIRGYS